jgi:FtsP/CotA-like multicopper oxidase with cupredoxin domain
VPKARPIAATGLALLVALALAACGDDDPAPTTGATSVAAPAPQVSTENASAASNAPSPAAGPGSAAPSPTQAVSKEVSYTIVKRRATPATGRVEVAKGEVVRITVTSDEADTLHVHGYDLELPLTAGAPGSITVKADRTGLFEVETHKSKLVLFQLLVR